MREFGDRRCSVLQGVSLPGVDHQPLRVVVLPFSAQLPEVEEMMLARGIVVSHETVRQRGRVAGGSFIPRLPQIPA